MLSERRGLNSMIYSVSEMSRSIYTAAQLALKSRSSAGTWQTAAGHRDKPETSGKAWLGPAAGSGMLWEQRDVVGAVGAVGCCGSKGMLWVLWVLWGAMGSTLQPPARGQQGVQAGKPFPDITPRTASGKHQQAV